MQDESNASADGVTFTKHCKREPDWTFDEAGRSNASSLFIDICLEVERLIRGDAHMLLAGRADSTARLIVAQLAHVRGLAPQTEAKTEAKIAPHIVE